MALTSTDVNNQSFSIDRKGYDVDEVDVFLERVATELDDLNGQLADLESQLNEVQRAQAEAEEEAAKPIQVGDAVVSGDAKREIEKRDARISELESQLEERRKDDSAIAQALIIAQRSADDIVAGAKDTASTTIQEAEEEGQRILDKANKEKQRVVDEIKQLEDEREETRQKYTDMLTDFVASANDVLVELGQSRTAARKSSIGTHGAVNSRDAQKTASLSAVSADVATYTTPTVNSVVVTPATPVPSATEKDFSGFGDTDDAFDFDDVD